MEAVQEVAVELGEWQLAESRPDVDPDDSLVPGARRRLDVEDFEVAVEELVHRGAGLGAPSLVDLALQPVRTRSASAAAMAPAGTTSVR